MANIGIYKNIGIWMIYTSNILLPPPPSIDDKCTYKITYWPAPTYDGTKKGVTISRATPASYKYVSIKYISSNSS